MSFTSSILCDILVLNFLQNFFIAWRLRTIVNEMGGKPDYMIRMLADQLFLYRIIRKEKEKLSVSEKRLFWYSVFSSSLQPIILILLVISL